MQNKLKKIPVTVLKHLKAFFPLKQLNCFS